MGFNYRREKKRFDEKWIETARQYRDAGMNCDQINRMYDFETALFRSSRTYINHTQLDLPEAFWELATASREGELYFNDLHTDLDQLLENLLPGLSKRITARDKEALLLVALGNSQQCAARKMGISQQVLDRHLKKIKKILQGGV